MACSSFCVFPTPTFPLANGFWFNYFTSKRCEASLPLPLVVRSFSSLFRISSNSLGSGFQPFSMNTGAASLSLCLVPFYSLASLGPTTQCRTFSSAHHPTSATNFPRRSTLHLSTSRSIAWIGPSHHSCLQLLTSRGCPISSNGPSWLASVASSSRPAGRPPSCPPPPALQTAKCATAATICLDPEFRA